MARTIELARRCQAEERARGTPPKVGVVVMKDGVILAEAYRGDPAGGPGDHAEFVALEKKLSGQRLDGATVFTTLEPCSSGRDSRKIPCVQRLITRGVARVYVGMLDPNPDIFGRGLQALVDAGIDVQLFDPYLQREAAAVNRRFALQFQAAGSEASTDLKVGGVVWKLETLIGASWADRDPTTARVSTLQLIGENQATRAINAVSGELETKKGTITGQLNRDGDLVPAETLVEVPPSARIILVFPLVANHWANGVSLLELPRLAPITMRVRVDDKAHTQQFSPAETADLVASFIRRNDPLSKPVPRWSGPPPRSKAVEAVQAMAARVTPHDAARHRGMTTLMRLRDPIAAADLLDDLFANELKTS